MERGEKTPPETTEPGSGRLMDRINRSRITRALSLASALVVGIGVSHRIGEQIGQRIVESGVLGQDSIPEPADSTYFREHILEGLSVHEPVPVSNDFRQVYEDETFISTEESRALLVVNDFLGLRGERQYAMGRSLPDTALRINGSFQQAEEIPDLLQRPLQDKADVTLQIQDFFFQRFSQGLRSVGGQSGINVRSQVFKAESELRQYASQHESSFLSQVNPLLTHLRQLDDWELAYVVELESLEQQFDREAMAVADVIYGPVGEYQGEDQLPDVTVPYDTAKSRAAQAVALEFWKTRGFTEPCHGEDEVDVQISNATEIEEDNATAQLEECEVTIRAGLPGEVSVHRLQDIMTHEYGHLLGLDHVDDPSSVMHESAGDSREDTTDYSSTPRLPGY